MKITITIDSNEKNTNIHPWTYSEYSNLEDLIFAELGYERVAIHSTLSDEKKKIFDDEISDAMKNNTVTVLEKKLGMQHYWRKRK